MIKIVIIGITGKMGIQIADLITANPNLYCLVSTIEVADVVIDFSAPMVTLDTVKQCLNYKKPLVVGTTGFNSKEKILIQEAATIIPILMSSNMSLSVNILFKLSALVAKKLADFDTEIVETHHRYKKDAPSGTAIKLGEVIAEARNIDFTKHAVFTRHGREEERNSQDIGFAVVRGGGTVGKHEVLFMSDNETLTLSSEINNRLSFARGALVAATFIVSKPIALYDMFDVLGI